jgi:hypothetical protein
MFRAMALPRLFRIAPLTVATSLAVLSLTHPCRAADDSSDAASEESDATDASTAKKPPAPDSKAPAKKPDDSDTTFGHMGQFGLRAGLVVGYRMIIRYSSSPYCATPDAGSPSSQQTFCGHGAPLASDLGLSFGVLDFLEPFAWARLGFGPEKETDTKPLVVLGAGVRIYTMSDAAFKIFIEPAVGFELEGGRGTPAYQTNNPDYKKDFVVHLAAGPQFDFARGVGAYVTGGVSTGVVRALGSSLDLSFGVQGRLL